MSKADPNRADVSEQASVSMLVHELRTPLTALRGSLGLLVEDVKDAAPDVRNFAAIAARNADKLALMLDDAADFWQLNDSATLLAGEPTDIVDTVQRAIEQVQALVDERGVVLDVRATPAEAIVDPALIRAAVARLLTYALRVSPRKSTLQIRIETVTSAGAAGRQSAPNTSQPSATSATDGPDAVHGRPSANEQSQAGASVVVSVSDGGRVIPADRTSRMFDPFSAVARRGAESSTGTGLDLAIARRIAILHRGSLVFSSTEKGGLFSLRLPA